MNYHKHNMGLKDAKINFLIDTATDLFLCRSIQDVTIKDIAMTSQVGEATIYRYFGNKQTLVVKAAMKLKSIINNTYFQVKKEMNGYEQIKTFYLSYLDIFKQHPEFYKFLNEFDAYMTGVNNDILNPYEAAIDEYKQAYMYAYQNGIKDGSIKKQEDIDVFYFSTTHALLELGKKLSSEAVLKQDKQIAKASELKCLIDLILNNIKN